MAIINKANEVLHKIKVRLYPDYLAAIVGAALKNRCGYTGNYGGLVEHAYQFLDS